MSFPYFAHADRSGVIRCGASVPAGALCVLTASRHHVRKIVSALARHAYDGKTLLVPGIPEAADDDAAIDALERFRTECERRLPTQRRLV